MGSLETTQGPLHPRIIGPHLEKHWYQISWIKSHLIPAINLWDMQSRYYLFSIFLDERIQWSFQVDRSSGRLRTNNSTLEIPNANTEKRNSFHFWEKQYSSKFFTLP